MLYDRVTIHVAGGAGGDGCVSFRREAHVPRGGPDGGDGGRGGDVVIVADRDLRDLSAFRHRRRYNAPRGAHGQGAKRHGAEGATLELRVPCGTVVELPGAGARFDLKEHAQRATAVHGGSGGAGNRRFVTSTRQAPRFAERGLSGEEASVELRLKLLADVGLVGAPNAGKSSLLRRLTRARPKVADYPFTTLEPALGTLEDDEGRQLVLADIPGLIEGASEGAGLGHDFLAHAERTRILVHLLELAPDGGPPPREAFAAVRAELESYGAGLAERPYILALSKADVADRESLAQSIEEWRALLANEQQVRREGDEVPIVRAVSSVTGEGIPPLVADILQHGLEERAREADARAVPDEAVAEHVVYRPAERSGYHVERSGKHSYRVSGPAVERLIARHDLENEEALAYIEERLKAMSVIRALEAAGFEPGEDVEIGGVTFALYPDDRRR